MAGSERLAREFDGVKSRDDVMRAIKDASDYTASMDPKETLKVLQEISAKEKKGQGLDVNILPDGSIDFTSPFTGHQKVELTPAAKLNEPQIKDAAKGLLATGDFARTGKIEGQQIPQEVRNAIGENHSNLSGLNERFNKTLEEQKSPFRVQLGYRDGLPGMHGDTVYERSMTVTDTRTGKPTMSLAEKRDSVR